MPNPGLNRPVTSVSALGSAPGAELLANHDELADVVGGVVGDEQQLADVRLAIAVRDLREQVDGLVVGEGFERRAVLAKRGDAVIPRGVATAARPSSASSRRAR